jgi:hypothetical protein
MKSILKYTITLLIVVFIIIQLPSCTKSTEGAALKLSYQMLADKTWYLDYSITGANKRTYVGQTTYFINFLKNKTTSDSDGLIGNYTIEKIENELQILVKAKTNSTNTIEYAYTIESIGSNNLVLTYILTGATVSTKLYFSTSK